MSILLTNATLLELNGPRVERADLRVKHGVIVERARRLKPKASEPVFDLSGNYVMPGMVCGHTHLYSALARGMPAPKKTPRKPTSRKASFTTLSEPRMKLGDA